MSSLNLFKCDLLKKDKRAGAETFILIYAIILALIAILLFLYGFIPRNFNESGFSTTKDVPKFVEQYRVKANELYQPMVQRLIIMVIDALRWDFVSNPQMKTEMPYLHELIETKSTCVLQAKVSPPTVTMPRIKAMTSGTVSNFMDIIFNFGNKIYNGDSIIRQTIDQGKKIVFYGDDTWLKLFPGSFERHDGTTSFFVTDYTEVDNNVTRHIENELNNKDWTIMILHYLGLDHIGHIYGPYNQLIKPKLKEMDKIINHIQKSVLSWNQNNIPSILMICGDHGMKDSGGHGGSSVQETLVPLIFIGAKCSTNLQSPKQISQIDVTSTLSVLLGIPIPKSNIGSISLEVLNNITTSKKLFVLYYNAKQIFQHFQKLSNYKSEDAYESYINAIKLHTAWINTNSQNIEIVDEIVEMYTSALIKMKNILLSKLIKCDISMAIIAIIFLLYALQTIISKSNGTKMLTMYVWLIHFVSLIIIYFILKWIFETEDDRIVYDKKEVVFLIITATLISYIFYFVNTSVGYSFQLPLINEIYSFNEIQYMPYLGSTLYIISLGSSSFIEEEHQTWYFLWTSFLISIMYKSIKKITNTNEHCCNSTNLRKVLIEVTLLLVPHRILRNLNSTGDKYAHLPDLADWLYSEKTKLAMTLTLIAGLLLLILIGYQNTVKKPKKYYLFLYSIASICIYIRHMKNDNVIKIPSFPITWMPNEIYLFWLLIMIDFIYNIYNILSSLIFEDRNLRMLIMDCILRNWIMISALLHQPYNVILLPLQVINAFVIKNVFENFQSFIAFIHFHIWLGYVYYFYQGNSNNFATIDIAAGYIGLNSYNPILTGIFLTINTYSAIVLSYFLIIYKLTLSNECSYYAVLTVNKQYIIWRLIPLFTCFIMVCLQRYHLFIWTVFFPKLLYEAAHCALIFSIILVILPLLELRKIINFICVKTTNVSNTH